MEKKDPIQEARRYLANAKTILKDKAVKNGNCYTDSKYTRMAGNTMWNGCLIVLEYALKLEKKKDQRLEVKDFKEAASKRSIKLNKEICEAYNILPFEYGVRRNNIVCNNTGWNIAHGEYYYMVREKRS